MVFKLVGAYGLSYVLIVYLFLAAVVLVLGQAMKWLVRGFLPELILEIPPYRRPSVRLTAYKLYYRVRGFLFEATPLILGGILLMNVLDYFRVFQGAARVLGPLVHELWGCRKPPSCRSSWVSCAKTWRPACWCRCNSHCPSS